MKNRIVRRPWGRRKNGGWIIQPTELLEALKGGEIAEFGKLQVGAKQLSRLITLMQFPNEEFLVTSKGQLEVETIKRIMGKKNGHPYTNFRKPRLQHSFRVSDRAWVPNSSKPKTILVIKPRKFG